MFINEQVVIYCKCYTFSKKKNEVIKEALCEETGTQFMDLLSPSSAAVLCLVPGDLSSFFFRLVCVFFLVDFGVFLVSYRNNKRQLLLL